MFKPLCALRNETLMSKKNKLEVLEKISGEDKSLEGEKMRTYCHYALPEK